MSMRTFLVMYFGTNNMKPSLVAKKLQEVGFECHYGPYDFIYDWGEREPTKEEILELGDKVSDLLKDSGAVFNLDTHD